MKSYLSKNKKKILKKSTTIKITNLKKNQYFLILFPYKYEFLFESLFFKNY